MSTAHIIFIHKDPMLKWQSHSASQAVSLLFDSGLGPVPLQKKFT